MRIAAALLAVPVRGDYGYGDYGYGDGDGPLQFDQSLTGAQLVEELFSADADLQFRNVRGSSHLDRCAALFANGHLRGFRSRRTRPPAPSRWTRTGITCPAPRSRSRTAA